ncbi:MAG: hypothetical protein HPY50_05080 [Firmicutes bacterium]|nr:hypothetical protein [Bacillota bacterium]
MHYLGDREQALFNQIIEMQREITALRFERWREYELLKPQWWLLLILFTVPWIVWWKLVDRKRIVEIFLYGMLVEAISVTLDVIFGELTFWVYPFKLFPIIPRYVEYDLALMPVSFMLVYQYFPRWKTFILAIAALSALLSFVGEPIAVWLGLYQPLAWKFHYSFFVYIAMGVYIKWLVDLTVKIKNRAFGRY